MKPCQDRTVPEIPVRVRVRLTSAGRLGTGRLGTSLHIISFPASPDSYLLGWVPNHVFDVLCVRVEDTDTLIFILFVNCGRKKS